MSGSLSVKSPEAIFPDDSFQIIPCISMAQSQNDVVGKVTSPTVMWAMPRDMMTSEGDPPQGPSLPERLTAAPLPDITDTVLHNDTDSPKPLSNAERVLVKHNVVARHALKTQNEDLNRQFTRIMAAHAAQERLIQAELRSIQQHTLSPAVGATASAVDFSQIMSSPRNLSASNGKYFISPFNRHKVAVPKGDSPSSVSLPSSLGHSSLGDEAQGKYSLSSRPKIGKIGVKSGNVNVTMAVTTGSGTTTTTMTSTQGMRVHTTHTSPALKLKQTASGGLKLQPVNLQQVNGAISEMKSKGGKPVRVKVQLKVKLPPLKSGKQSPMLPQPKYDPSQLQMQQASGSPYRQKQSIRFSSSSPKDIAKEEASSFGSLRKIDIVFSGERAEARSVTPPETPPMASTNEYENRTLVLRCADGTLCRVPIGGTNKLQKLIAARDTSVTRKSNSSSKGRQNPIEGLTGKSMLKSCLKKPRSKVFPGLKKSVHFAPDVIEVNRESKETELQPTVKIGSKFYTIKLPNIKSLQHVPVASDRYAVRSVTLLPKIPELTEDFRGDLDAIEDIDEGDSINDDGEENESDVPSEDRPYAARRRISINKDSDEKLPKYKDVVLQVRMKKKKTPSPSPDMALTAPTPSPDEFQESETNPGKYMVSKVHDRWKVTIKNSSLI